MAKKRRPISQPLLSQAGQQAFDGQQVPAAILDPNVAPGTFPTAENLQRFEVNGAVFNETPGFDSSASPISQHPLSFMPLPEDTRSPAQAPVPAPIHPPAVADPTVLPGSGSIQDVQQAPAGVTRQSLQTDTLVAERQEQTRQQIEVAQKVSALGPAGSLTESDIAQFGPAYEYERTGRVPVEQWETLHPRVREWIRKDYLEKRRARGARSSQFTSTSNFKTTARFTRSDGSKIRPGDPDWLEAANSGEKKPSESAIKKHERAAAKRAKEGQAGPGPTSVTGRPANNRFLTERLQATTTRARTSSKQSVVQTDVSPYGMTPDQMRTAQKGDPNAVLVGPNGQAIRMSPDGTPVPVQLNPNGTGYIGREGFQEFINEMKGGSDAIDAFENQLIADGQNPRSRNHLAGRRFLRNGEQMGVLENALSQENLTNEAREQVLAEMRNLQGKRRLMLFDSLGSKRAGVDVNDDGKVDFKPKFHGPSNMWLWEDETGKQHLLPNEGLLYQEEADRIAFKLAEKRRIEASGLDPSDEFDADQIKAMDLSEENVFPTIDDKVKAMKIAKKNWEQDQQDRRIVEGVARGEVSDQPPPPPPVTSESDAMVTVVNKATGERRNGTFAEFEEAVSSGRMDPDKFEVIQ